MPNNSKSNPSNDIEKIVKSLSYFLEFDYNYFNEIYKNKL